MRLFLQAKGGIRNAVVTGVQTCALPISGVGGGIAGLTGRARAAARRVVDVVRLADAGGRVTCLTGHATTAARVGGSAFALAGGGIAGLTVDAGIVAVLGFDDVFAGHALIGDIANFSVRAVAIIYAATRRAARRANAALAGLACRHVTLRVPGTLRARTCSTRMSRRDDANEVRVLDTNPVDTRELNTLI